MKVMTIEEVVEGFDLVINEKYTFAYVLKNGIANIGIRWKADSTKRNNMADYHRKILPMFKDKPIEEYTRESCEQLINDLTQRVGCQKKREDDYKRLIESVFAEAEIMGICRNPLWDSKAARHNTFDLDVKVRNELKKLVKFFTAEQELKTCNLLFKNPEQDECSMGLLLMFATGARNLEAAAICFEDIVFKGGVPCIVIINSIDNVSAKAKAGTKTKNGYRYYPIPMRLYDFLMRRKAWLQGKVDNGEIKFKTNSEFQSVDSLPVTCDGSGPLKYCTARDLTEAGRKFFIEIGISGEQLYTIQENMKEEENSSVFGNFKDPTSYSFRRNRATHMCEVNCSILQCRYLMGHALYHESVERYHFNNDNEIRKIYKRLVCQPLLNEINYAGSFACLDEGQLYLKKTHQATLYVNAKGHAGQTLVVKIKPREPHEVTKVELSLVGSIENGRVRGSYSKDYHMDDDKYGDALMPLEMYSLYNYWKPYVKVQKEQSMIIKELFAKCDMEKLLACVAVNEKLPGVEAAAAQYLPILKELEGATVTTQNEQYILGIKVGDSVSVLCLSAPEVRTCLAANFYMDQISEDSLQQSEKCLDMAATARMPKYHCISDHSREDVLGMRVLKENVEEIEAERMTAKILCDMANNKTVMEAEIKKSEEIVDTIGRELTEEPLDKKREQALYNLRVYQQLKKYSYLWCDK